ncbi:hypothetical protein pb186bvf_007773 [Paramecium bursaria]
MFNNQVKTQTNLTFIFIICFNLLSQGKLLLVVIMKEKNGLNDGHHHNVQDINYNIALINGDINRNEQK